MNFRLLTMSLALEQDVVLARQRTRHVAQVLGFSTQDQTRIATAVSEIARNAFVYAGTGKVHLSLEGAPVQQFVITVSDEGPGIAKLADILAGRYRSTTGMGIGLLGTVKLMDDHHIDTGPTGTTVVLRKDLPASAGLWGAAQVAGLASQLASSPVVSSFDEVQRHNQELLLALGELRDRQEQLLQLTAELEDTNRGVVALYAELDEKAEHLRRADELKSRFLSNMSHEFRTPLSSIRALAKLLLNRVDGDLGMEQEKQVSLILRGAEDLSELVNDLLDLAKIESGKTDVRITRFTVANLFSGLRGVLRPLLTSAQVELIFRDAESLPAVYSDEGKISQILRNFVSNALKFTERGEVEVSAGLVKNGTAMEFRVRDTGLGIAPEHESLIFEEFAQIENRLQHTVKGTGLGLPLCRKLAQLLDGDIRVESQVNVGSTFIATIPLQHRNTSAAQINVANNGDQATSPAVLIVERDPTCQLLYEKYLADAALRALCVERFDEAVNLVPLLDPAVLVISTATLQSSDVQALGALQAREPAYRPRLLLMGDDAQSMAADAYLSLPLDQHQLLSAVQRLAADRAEDAP